MPNDLPMLAWAGTSYAMANAHPDVLATATHQAASNDEDGVAQILEAMLDRRRPSRGVATASSTESTRCTRPCIARPFASESSSGQAGTSSVQC